MKRRRGEHHSTDEKGIESLLVVFLELREGMLLLRALRKGRGTKDTDLAWRRKKETEKYEGKKGN